MKFEQAEKKLKRIAKKRFCTIAFERTYYEGNLPCTECRVYIEGFNTAIASTWKQAFFKLKEEMEPSLIEDELPQGDA